MRKRISEHVDLILFDIAEPLRTGLSSLAHVLLGSRQQRMQRLFSSLLGSAAEHGLPVSVETLVRRSKPMVSIQQLSNWIDAQTQQTQEEKLEVLRSDLPQRWLEGLRRAIQEESDAVFPGETSGMKGHTSHSKQRTEVRKHLKRERKEARPALKTCR